VILIKETFYLIKVGQLYVCGVDGKHLTSRFGMRTSDIEVNEVYLTPKLNEALIFDKDDPCYEIYCHAAAMMRTKLTRMEQAA
jgi:hypothetical protein